MLIECVCMSDKRHSNTHVNTRRQLGIPTLSWRMMCGLSYLHTKVLAFRPGGIFRQPICHLCSPVAGPENSWIAVLQPSAWQNLADICLRSAVRSSVRDITCG